MINRTEFRRATKRLYDYIDRSFAKNPQEGKVVRADLERRLSSGHPFLDEVKIRKVGDSEYSGRVKIDDGEDVGIVRFKYNSLIPFNEIDRYLDSSAVSIEGKKHLAEKIVHVTVMKASGKEITGDLRNNLVNYIQGSVPYAIAFLEDQIRMSGKMEGTFKIPRAYRD